MIRPLRVFSKRIEHMPSIAEQIGTGDPAK
jgi:hypothetical protein